MTGLRSGSRAFRHRVGPDTFERRFLDRLDAESLGLLDEPDPAVWTAEQDTDLMRYAFDELVGDLPTCPHPPWWHQGTNPAAAVCDGAQVPAGAAVFDPFDLLAEVIVRLGNAGVTVRVGTTPTRDLVAAAAGLLEVLGVTPAETS